MDEELQELYDRRRELAEQLATYGEDEATFAEFESVSRQITELEEMSNLQES
jgi:flagellar biosynthesis chaperone FliJ